MPHDGIQDYMLYNLSQHEECRIRKKENEEQFFVRRLCLEQLKMMLQFLTRNWHQTVVLNKGWEHGLIMLFVVPNITNKHPIMQGNQHLKRA